MCFGFSDKDDLAFVAHGGVLAVVADGMGGMANGGEASHLAVRAFLHAYMAKQSDETIPAAMRRALDDANQSVINLSHQVVALVLAKDRPSQDNLTVAILACEPDSVPTIKLAPGMPPPRKCLG